MASQFSESHGAGAYITLKKACLTVKPNPVTFVKWIIIFKEITLVLKKNTIRCY